MARYVPAQNGNSERQKSGSEVKKISKTVQDYGNWTADICLAMQAVGQAGHSLSLCDNCNLYVHNFSIHMASSAEAVKWSSVKEEEQNILKDTVAMIAQVKLLHT